MVIARTRAWLLVGLIACTSNHTQQQDPRPPVTGDAGGSGSATVIKTPGQQGGAFVQGAALAPGDKLVAWLDGQKVGNEAKLLRVPVVLAKGQVGFQLRGAKLGTAGDAVEVNINDSALGIGLGQRARKCKDEVCAFLVEGHWRGKQEGAFQLDVVKAGDEPLAADELAKLTHAEVEGESGN